MRIARLAKLPIVIGLVSVLVGCTSLFKSSQNVTPPPLKPDSAPEANLQPLSASTDSCSSPILEPDRSALLQEALADSQLQAVKAQLESRGFGIKAEEAQAVQLAGGQQLVIPFGENAHLVWTRTNGQTAAVGLIRQGNKTLNVSADGQERIVRFLPQQKVEKLLRKLREKSKFQEFEGKLAQKGKRVGKVRVLFNETNKIAILGIASEGDEEKIAHQVRIKVKADKDDEPEDDAEPAIQATACGQATGEAVPMGARMQPLALPPGEGDIGGGYEGPQICTSQWGYDYLCLSRTPAISLSTTTLTLPQTFITQQVQASFVIWNSGGGTLTGTVSAPAPFSIVSGNSFSLLPGQLQEVVVRFSSGTAGSFSKSISISSNGGNKTISLSGTSWAHHFLGELQKDGNTLRVGMLDSIDAFRTGVFFNPFSSQPLYFWLQFDRGRQEGLITLESHKGERLQGRIRVLQAPAGEVNCPVLLPSDFEDQQKLQAAYQCYVDAGMRVEISLQFKDYSVTLPVLLSSESDYVAAQEAMRQIASRASPDFKEAIRGSAGSIDDATVQAFANCLQNNLIQQPSATRMIPLGISCRARACFACLSGLFGTGRGWTAYLRAAFTPGLGAAAAIGAVIGLYGGTLFGVGGAAMGCPDCIRGCNNNDPPPPGGGGCTSCKKM